MSLATYASKTKKDLSFEDLAGPVKKKKKWRSRNTASNYGHKISNRFTQADYSNKKAHTLPIKLAIYGDICQLLSFSSTSLVQITEVSLAKLHKRPEDLARYYLTSHWQAQWAKIRRWKTIESSPPTPLELRRIDVMREKKNVPYFFAYKTQHFFNESLLDSSKSERIVLHSKQITWY